MGGWMEAEALRQETERLEAQLAAAEARAAKAEATVERVREAIDQIEHKANILQVCSDPHVIAATTAKRDAVADLRTALQEPSE